MEQLDEGEEYGGGNYYSANPFTVNTVHSRLNSSFSSRQSLNSTEMEHEVCFKDLKGFLNATNMTIDEEGNFMLNQGKIKIKMQKDLNMTSSNYCFQIVEEGKYEENKEESKEVYQTQEIDFERTLQKLNSRKNSASILSRFLSSTKSTTSKKRGRLQGRRYQPQQSTTQFSNQLQSLPTRPSSQCQSRPPLHSNSLLSQNFRLPSHIDGQSEYQEVRQRIELVYLYASPLCLKQKGKGLEEMLRSMDQLDFQKELKEIQSEVKGIKREIKVQSVHGTINNLTRVLVQRPFALHFTGHGIPNTEQNFGPQFRRTQDINFYLLLEQEDGEGILLSDVCLKEQLASLEKNVDLVFVSSCYSEFAGQVFKNAGVKHVVCVSQKHQVKDMAAICFAKSFYHSIFSQNTSICQAFDLAQKLVQATWGAQESGKFKLLRNEEGEGGHLCSRVHSLRPGRPTFVDTTPVYFDLPSKQLDLIGRKKAIFDVVQNTFKNRLFVQMGLVGSGKSSACKSALHFIAARNMFEAGILYYNLKGSCESKIMVKQLLAKLVLTGEDFKVMKKQGAQNLLVQVLEEIARKDKKLLIMFDNAEDLICSDKQHFWWLIYKMLAVCPCLHILITTTMLNNHQIGRFKKDIRQDIKYLPELTDQQSLELFRQVSRPFSKEEENELLQETGPSRGKGRVKNLAEHRLFKLLGGNPLAITLASFVHQKMSLKKLFLQLDSPQICSLLKVQDTSLSEIAEVSSLESSLEVSLRTLEQESPSSLDLFYLLALLPGGIEEPELYSFYGDQASQLLQKLWEYSLIQKKEEGSPKVELPQIMSIQAIKRVSPSQKLALQSDICFYYQQICRRLLERNGAKSESSQKLETCIEKYSQEQMKGLLEHEQNIHAAILRFTTHQREEEKKKLEVLELIHKQGLQDIIKKAPTSQSRDLSAFNTLLHVDSRIGRPQYYLEKGERKKKWVEDEEERKEHSRIEEEESRDEKDEKEEQLRQLRKEIRIEVEKFDSNRQKSVNTETKSKNKKILLEQVEKDSHSMLSKMASFGQRKVQVEVFKQMSLNKKIENQEPEMVDETDSIFSESDLEDEVDLDEDEVRIKEGIKKAIIKSMDRHSMIQIGRQKILLGTGLDQMKHLERNQSHGALERLNTVAIKRAADLNNTKDGVISIHPAESLIIDYLMNLSLMSETDYALQFIAQTARQIQGSDLYQANLLRIEGILLNNKLNYREAIGSLNESKKLYLKCKSVYGVALVNFSIGYMYFNNLTQLIYKHEAEKILRAAKIFFSNSLNQFQALNHLRGISVCCKYLSKVASNLRQFSEAQAWMLDYQYHLQLFKKGQLTPSQKKLHVERIHGKDVSLLSEQVYDNDNSDLFNRNKEQKGMDLRDSVAVAILKTLKQKLDYLKEENIEDKTVREAEQFMENMTLQVAHQLLNQIQTICLNNIQQEQISRFLDEEKVLKHNKKQLSTLNKGRLTIIKKAAITRWTQPSCSRQQSQIDISGTR